MALIRNQLTCSNMQSKTSHIHYITCKQMIHILIWEGVKKHKMSRTIIIDNFPATTFLKKQTKLLKILLTEVLVLIFESEDEMVY